MFARLFNWIKFKTLPPSVNFKNRLFIERDNKHKRIATNLGLTFRNSKWSQYRRANLSLNSVTSLKMSLKFLLPAILFMLLVLSASKYALFLNVASKVYTVFWFMGDTNVYTQLTFLLMSASFLGVWAENFLNYLTFSTLHSKFNQDYNGEKSSIENQDLPDSQKSTHSSILFKFLLRSDIKSYKLFSKVYSFEKGFTFTSNLTFYQLLFKSTTPVKSYINLGTFLNAETCSPSCGFTSIPTSLTNKLSSKSTKSTWPLQSSSSWSLDTLTNQTTLDLTSLTRRGFFSTPLSNLSEIDNLSCNTNLSPLLDESLSSQISWARNTRWMYRYNLLHRRSVLNSHKSTLTKRLVGSGFYDSSLDSLNIQISSIKNLNSGWGNLISNMYSLSYKGFFDYTDRTSLNLSRNYLYSHLTSPSYLSFSEESFFWVLKKFSTFNTLGNLFRENSLTPKKSLIGTPGAKSLTPNQDWLNLKLIYQQPTSLLDVLSTSRTRRYDTQTNTSSSLPLLHVSYLTSDTLDLFTFDFTEKMTLLFKKPTHGTNNYPYYSFLHQPTTTNTTYSFKKLN